MFFGLCVLIRGQMSAVTVYPIKYVRIALMCIVLWWIISPGLSHDGVMTWKCFLHYWPFCKGNPSVTGGFPSQMVSECGVLIFRTICWTNSRCAGDSMAWLICEGGLYHSLLPLDISSVIYPYCARLTLRQWYTGVILLCFIHFLPWAFCWFRWWIHP